LTARAAVSDDRPMTSKAGYWLGAGLMVLAVVGAILWVASSAAEGLRTVDDFQRVPVPGTETVQLEDRKLVIYVEGPGVDEIRPDVRFAIFDARTEQRLRIAPYSGSLTYSFSRSGAAVATVTPPRSGDYVVRTQGRSEISGFDLAIGESIAGRILRTILGALVIGGVLGLGGTGLIVATSVRRGRLKRTPLADSRSPQAAPGAGGLP